MKIVVITGSTRGIGFGLAEAFLDLGCAVVVNGRSQTSVDQAIQRLAVRHNTEQILGFAADVADLAQVEAMWSAAIDRFGQVDIWINNAG
jgi:NAD(P)-dependent dehydrogenase (short-subunit alcohol dehydrogenase family)